MLLDRVESPPNIEVKGHGGVTPLHWASNNGDRDAVKLLLDKGANINAKTDCGVTPLHLACYHGGNKSVITLLLNRGACLDPRDHDGYTPLHYAGIKSDIVDLLIKRGAKKDVIIDEIRSARSDDEDHAVVAIGTLNVAKIYRSDSTSSERNVPRKVSFDSSLVEYDVFLSHCWGEDAEGSLSWNISLRTSTVRSIDFCNVECSYCDNSMIFIITSSASNFVYNNIFFSPSFNKQIYNI